MQMAKAQEVLRNALVLAGGYYLSTWLVAPFWFLVGPWTNRGGHPIWVSTLVGLVPALIASAAAGFAVGVALETARPGVWALGFGALVAGMRWMSWRWHLPPDWTDRARQAIAALNPAAAAIAGVFVGRRYATARSRTSQSGAASEAGG
jgi:hypothetical protein